MIFFKKKPPTFSPEGEGSHPEGIASLFTLHSSRSPPLGEDGRGLMLVRMVTNWLLIVRNL